MQKHTRAPQPSTTPLQVAVEAVVGGLNGEHRRLALRERAALRDITALALIRLARADGELEHEAETWRQAA